MESWNYSFKIEAIRGERFLTRSDGNYQVFDYIGVLQSQMAEFQIVLCSPETFDEYNRRIITINLK